MEIPRKAYNIMSAIKKAGKGVEALIVGGFVRDSLLGVESKDIDIEVYKLPLDHIEIVLRMYGWRVDAVGKSFGVLKVDNEIDISVPRREKKVGEGHKGFSIESDPDMSVEKAASRRDFTVNSMAMDIDGNIIDLFGGKKDLLNPVPILRMTSDRFKEDPLRVLRAMQFAARFDMEMESETLKACQSMLPQKIELAKERVWEEWKKWALKGKVPGRGVEQLEWMNWADPEIHALVGVAQDPEWHPEGDAWIHTLCVVDAAVEIADREQLDDHDRLVLMFAALCHDFGKPSTTKMEGGRLRSKGHCEAGVELAERFLKRIGAPIAIIEEVKPLVAEHLIHAGIKNPSSRAVRRLANRLAPTSIEALGRLVEADHSGRPPLPKGNPFQVWVDKAHDLNVFSEKPKPILMGRHLVEMGISPGKAMGVLLNRAFEVQLDGGFKDVNSAIDWARNHLEWLDKHMGSYE
jgi:tRNA nucleotidyltransferase (CCA-adding enzyme)